MNQKTITELTKHEERNKKEIRKRGNSKAAIEHLIFTKL